MNNLGLTPILWGDVYKTENVNEKDIRLMREKKFEICNGIAFVNNTGRFVESFSLATYKNDDVFYKRVIGKKLHQMVLLNFRALHQFNI